MARPRFDRLDPDKQEAILAAAADEFAEHGYRAASLNRIIERARTSKGSFYYYFDDKADLLRTVLERAVLRALAEYRLPSLEAFTAADFWDRVRDYALSALPLMELDTWWMRIVRAFYKLREEPAALEATMGVLEQSKGLVAEMIRRGRELGVVRTDLPEEMLVEVYMAMDEAGDRWMLRRWSDLDQAARRQLVEGRMDLARDLLDARHMGWER